MASLSNNPFYGSSSSQGTVTPASGSTQRLALDNLIRRELKVGDPNDPAQIAQALLNRYKDNPRAISISQEAKGLPFLLSAPTTVCPPLAPTSSGAEVQQAIDDVHRDLEELTTSAVLKDIKLELQGWESTLRSTITEGITTARFALDPRQRDKVFGIRRTLGDYARLSRLVGALTPVLNINYRKLAQSLDEVSSVLLVLMGEALANIGFSGGRYLLQVPYSELQMRRDAVVYALRNLTGSAQEAYDGNEWQRGIGAYRKLFQTLEAQGQGDLRALLVENELVRVMDALIQRSGQGSAEGLRQLGVTAQVEVERFRRLVFIVQADSTAYTAPPLAAFLDALLLFTEAFDASGGYRLLRIARPAIMFYGLYGIGGMDNAEKRLVRLVTERGELAERLDCFMQRGGNFESAKAKTQVVLDKVLYDVDRAIDLYAVGTKDFGEPEKRASAYGDIIKQLEDEILSSSIEVRGSGGGFLHEGGSIGRTPRSTDQCSFAYLKLRGNKGSIVARVVSLENIRPYTLAGLMIRQKVITAGLPDAGARYAMVALSANYGVLFGHRSTPQQDSTWQPDVGKETQEDTPYWLKLEWRVEKTSGKPSAIVVTAYKSDDGTTGNWVSVGDKVTLSLDQGDTLGSVTVGIVVTASSPDTSYHLATAAFDSVVVEGAENIGSRASDWHLRDIGSPGVAGKLDTSESYLALTLREDYELRYTLDNIQKLLQPLSGDGDIRWDEDSKSAFDKDDAKVLRMKELCVQRDLENRWDDLVKTMAPSCVSIGNAVKDLLDHAISRNVTDQFNECRRLDVLVPSTQEESQKAIADILNHPTIREILDRIKRNSSMP